MIDIEIDYNGGNARTKHGTVGLRLYWSSDTHVMTPVPEEVFFHKE